MPKKNYREHVYFRMLELLNQAPNQKMSGTELKKQVSNEVHEYKERTLEDKLIDLLSSKLVSRDNVTCKTKIYKLTPKGRELLKTNDPGKIFEYVRLNKVPQKKRSVAKITKANTGNETTSLKVIFKIPSGPVPKVVTKTEFKAIEPQKSNPLAHLSLQHRAQLEFQRKTNRNLSLFQFFKNHTQSTEQLTWMKEQIRIGKIYAEDFDHPSKEENLKKPLQIKDLVELYERDSKRRKVNL